MVDPKLIDDLDYAAVDASLQYIARSQATENNDVELEQHLDLLLTTSRQSPETRRKIGSEILLPRLIDVVSSHGIESQTGLLAIKLIGNSFDGNDTARDIVIKVGLEWLQRALTCTQPEILNIVIKVLFNFSVNYPPAQQACYNAHVQFSLIEIYASQNAGEGVMFEVEFISDLLLNLLNHKDTLEPALKERLPDHILLKLIQMPERYIGESNSLEDAEVEIYASLLEAALIYLRDKTVQSQVLHKGRVENVWRAFESLEATITIWKLDDLSRENVDKFLVPLSQSLGWSLSDLSAADDFARAYPLESAFIQSIISLVRSSSSEQNGTSFGRSSPEHLLATGYQILGNLLRMQDEAKVASLVLERDLHHALWQRMSSEYSNSMTEANLLYSIAGLLIQLSRPSVRVREVLCNDASVAAALQNLCTYKMPQVQQIGLKLLRALGKDCPSNQARFHDLAQQTLQSVSDSDVAAASEQPG